MKRVTSTYPMIEQHVSPQKRFRDNWSRVFANKAKGTNINATAKKYRAR